MDCVIFPIITEAEGGDRVGSPSWSFWTSAVHQKESGKAQQQAILLHTFKISLVSVMSHCSPGQRFFSCGDYVLGIIAS